MDEDDRSYRPAWLQYAPWLGTPPELTRRQWRILGLIAFAVLFDQYDMTLLAMALKQIQMDLAIPEAELGRLGAVIRLGALPAFLIVLSADLFGRRRVMLYTIVGYTLLTGATALAPDTQTFIVLQFLARTFAVAEVLLAYVVITEEIDAAHRGWGIGALAALGACGSGLALLLFAAVDVLPYGWRALYFFGLVPLLAIAWFSRNLPETRRYKEANRSRSEPVFSLKPVMELVTAFPKRLIGIASVVALLAFAENAGGFFVAKYLQEAHGWAPWQYSVLGFFGGFIGIFGSAYAGRLSDRLGRRRVGIIFLAIHPLVLIAFYSIGGPLLGILWTIRVFVGIGGDVVLGAYGNEMFPTSHRSTAAGARMIAATVGGVAGLAVESLLYGFFGSHWTAVSVLAVFALFAPFIVALFPETSGRELEDISARPVERDG
jgi:putative MFS transporter